MDEIIVGGIFFIVGLFLIIKGMRTYGRNNLIWIKKDDHETAHRTNKFRFRGFIMVVIGILCLLITFFTVVPSLIV